MEMPIFIRSIENFQAHIDSLVSDDDSGSRGKKFLDMAKKTVNLHPLFSDFDSVQTNPKQTHDGGYDLFARSKDGSQELLVQSKFKIRKVDEIDQIISKFGNILAERTNADAQGNLFQKEGKDDPRIVFSIVTSSLLDGLVERYKRTSLASKKTYDDLVGSSRLIIVDGRQLFDLVERAYRRSFGVPAEIKIKSQNNWLKTQGAYLGFVPGDELVRIYKEVGEAIFFENIRDFLGPKSGQVSPDDETVNEAIFKTISEMPESFVQMNNGVTFKGIVVNHTDDQILIKEASIVNGCQTTTTLARSDNSSRCVVVVKVVTDGDSWEVTKSANFQNQIGKIELELARYIRPQLVRQAAANTDTHVTDKISETALSLLDSFIENRVQYEEVKLLLIALVSRSPKNIVDLNYSKIEHSALSEIEKAAAEGSIVEKLLLIVKYFNSEVAALRDKISTEDYAENFQRVFDDKKPRYRIFLGILALCGMLKFDISKKTSHEVASFVDNSIKLLEARTPDFRRALFHAFNVFLQDSSDRQNEQSIQQHMNNTLRKDFTILYSRMRSQIETTAIANQI